MSESGFNHENEYELPSSLTISKFSAARGNEIQVMQKSLSSTSGTKLAFQKLPKHMRRRAMSHNVKRLPRRLREIHFNQMKKSGLPPKQKRPSRKYRRRPYNLLSDYMKRQRKHRWLDTHIWHAKRFHMIEKWGYKLPDRPCDRAFRACYRATVNHCLLQDISYYSCVEIKGDYEIIVNNFKKITDPCIGLTIAAKSFSRGCREGKITVFRSDDSKKAIGMVYFQWRPSQPENKGVLWLWIHAAYYTEALDTLINCFQFKLNNLQQDLSNETAYYTNINNVELKELKLELNRFRLTGTLSNAVLQNCFQIAENTNHAAWLANYYDNNTDNLLLQKEYWKSLKTVVTAELPPHIILSLTILDPRLYLPKKRTKASLEINESSNWVDVVPEQCADGPVWDYTVRSIVKDSKISNAQLAELRSNLLVPGSDLEEKGAAIPVTLIQRPGMKSQRNIGYGSGWDIIIPSGWAQPIWISLIMWGARAGGLRETNSIAFEMNQPNCLHPDTTAGIEEERFISDKSKEEFFKLPPNKRTNYNKFKISSPFEWNWTLLLNNWNKNDSPIRDFVVLRDKNVLRNIQKALTSKAAVPDCSNNFLIPVSIQFINKGLCKQFAVICLPHKEDLRKAPTEAGCLDENEKIRKAIRRNHKALLKRLRRSRIRAKRDGKVIPIDLVMLKEYRSTMRKLWLPEATNIRQSCSREVMGFVRDGDFSFLLGQSKALGYIAMSAIPTLLSLKSNKVLVRNTNSKQYRLGTLEVICE